MFIKIINKQSISYVLLSSIVRVTFSQGEDKQSCDMITSEIVSGTTHNYTDKTSQTTSSSKSIRVFKETNQEAYAQLLAFVGGK
jgi:hypothetical protein